MSKAFKAPRPSFFLMWLLGFVNRWVLLTGLPLLRRIPVIRDLPLVRGYFWLREIDLPAADEARLRRAVNPGTAAFIGPNHPEFGFDWMMDKELSTRVAPRMASWAAHQIVATAPGFWLRNNLISHNGGQAAVNHSVDWALRGNGVLLHPEGSVHWTAGTIHPLFKGIAEMACAAARRAGVNGRPVYIVPVVWRLEYVGDVGPALHREMAYIERSLGLPESEEVDAGARLQSLQTRILNRRMLHFGFDARQHAGCDFFTRQDAFRSWLMTGLLERYPVDVADSDERTLTRVERAVHDALRLAETDEDRAARRHDHAIVHEAMRLCGFSREAYGETPLTQEQIGESLKRIRATLLRHGLRNVIHNFVPTPFGPRVARVRVPEPILVDPARAVQDDGYAAELLARLRLAMQAAIDGCGIHEQQLRAASERQERENKPMQVSGSHSLAPVS